jgi:signal transduction histidine kinase
VRRGAGHSDRPTSAQARPRRVHRPVVELVTISIDNAQTEADLSASRSRVVAASDGTRRRIERDLHDGAQQKFVSVAINLQLAQIMIERGDTDATALLRDALINLDAGVDELLRLTRGIHPSLLSDVGLQGALQHLADSSGTPATLTFDADQTFDHATYYVVSEALTNIAKHAQAHAAYVDINERNGVLTIVVSDDGRGGASDHPGSGLAGLRDRAHTLGGRLKLDSQTDRGTTISVSLPAAHPIPGVSALS